MPGLREDLVALHDPANIRKAALASSPYVLRKILAADPRIRRLIRAGEKVIPLIAEEMRKAERLDEITLAALAFVIESVKAEAAPEILGTRFRKSVEKPDTFFVHFAAHAIRSSLRLPIRPLEMHYSPAELIETRNKLR
jgi:hypothetical protein